MRPVRRSHPSSPAAGVAALLGALCVASCSQSPPPPPVAATLLEPPLELPEVSLTDKTGETFTTELLNGRFNLLFFGFTHCPDICPLTLAVLARMGVEWNTPHIDVPQVVFVSVDPARDDAERIDNYLGHFDPAFQGVTGPREAMDPWLKALGVAVHVDPHAEGEPYTVTHNSTVYVVGPGSELIAVFSPPHDSAVIAADFLRIRDHYLRTHAADPSASS
ncbi:MAG: SCO family protein [Rhodospirillaceae bacterium]|nr:SCO family protein [Rhodospirillaceae bacterium]